MNRAERRRQQKQTSKNPTYNINDDSINKIKSDVAQKATDAAFVMMLAFPIMVLKHDLHFGKFMMEQVIDGILDKYQKFQNGEISIPELLEVIEQETGDKVEIMEG